MTRHPTRAAEARRHPSAGGAPRAFRAGAARQPAAGRGRGRALWLAHGDGGACQPAARACASCSPPRMPAAAWPRRASPSSRRRRSCGPTRSRRGCRPTPCIRASMPRPTRCRSAAIEDAADRRRRAGARPGHRPAQRRRDLPLGRGVRGDRDRHHRAAQPGGDRRAGQVRLRRARTRGAGQRAEPRARARRAEGARLPGGRARRRRRKRSRRAGRCGGRWRWCSAPRARACGN